MKHLLLISLSTLLLSACNSNGIAQEKATSYVKPEVDLSTYSKAYFASGCFWCVEAVFESVEGVSEAVSGYAGGETENPTYESIGTGRTGHAESVEVYYDPSVVSYQTLVKVFYGSHDPTTVNGQAPDFGTQYRSIIFYQNEEEGQIANAFKDSLEQTGKYDKPLATEIVPLDIFYPAEEYHQDYEVRNPNNPYVRNVSIPRLDRFKRAYPDLLKEGH
ncbi:MAG: peptide-methionine (S)-S-oxide reductase MsrA [Bacteroidetes bacterium]|nr:peptide-methionine (S)-S-oxide reductase MsrA [Bacteroidota bacterium]